MLNNSNYSLLPFTEYTALIYFLPQTKNIGFLLYRSYAKIARP